jgi:alkylhydroperoxidase family enzyme
MSAGQKIPLVSPDDCSEEQRELINRGRGDRPYVPKVFATLANHPALMKPWLAFGATVLYKGKLPGRDRETLILRAARNCDAEYEWGQHVTWARREGLSDDEVNAIGTKAIGSASGAAAAPGLDDWHRTLVRAADELASSARLTDATWNELASRYDNEQLLEACFVVGQYTMLAYALNSAGVTREDGASPLGRAS